MASIQPTEKVEVARHCANGHEAVEIRDPALLDRHARGRHRLEAKADPKDQAGEADAADRGASSSGSVRGRTRRTSPEEREVQPGTWSRSCPRPRGSCRARRSPRRRRSWRGGPGAHRNQIAARQIRLHEVAEGHPGFAHHGAGRGIELEEDAIQAAGQKRPAGAVQGHVAVAAAAAVGRDRGTVGLGQRRRRLGGITGAAGEHGRARCVPAGELTGRQSMADPRPGLRSGSALRGLPPTARR